MEAIAQREREMRQSLIEARDALLRRDDEIDRLHGECEARAHAAASNGGLGAANGEAAGLDAGKRALEKEVERLASKLDARDRKLLERRMRLSRIERSVPVRVLARLTALPGLRLLAARRETAFEHAVSKAHKRRTGKRRSSRSK